MDSILSMSRGISVILFIVYGAFLFFQLFTVRPYTLQPPWYLD
jgi:Ca2+/H+ antiporter